MQVDPKKKIVTYQIPHPSGKLVTYEETLWSGINDDPKRLEALRI